MFKTGPAGCLLCAFWIYFCFLALRGPVLWVIDTCGCKGFHLHDIEINDDIDKYQNCLDDDDKEWSLMEEKGLNKFGIISKVPEQIEWLGKGHLKDKKMHLTGIHTYNILRNPNYH